MAAPGSPHPGQVAYVPSFSMPSRSQMRAVSIAFAVAKGPTPPTAITVPREADGFPTISRAPPWQTGHDLVRETHASTSSGTRRTFGRQMKTSAYAGARRARALRFQRAEGRNKARGVEHARVDLGARRDELRSEGFQEALDTGVCFFRRLKGSTAMKSE